MIEFIHVLLLRQSIFHLVCYKLCRIVQFSLHIGSEILLTDMVEFNHVFFLLYQSVFHSAVPQVVQDSTVFTAYRITNITDMVEFNHLFSSYIRVFFIVLCYKLCRLDQFSLHIEGSQMLLKNMVEFNHLLFLLYCGIFSQFCATICRG